MTELETAVEAAIKQERERCADLVNAIAKYMMVGDDMKLIVNGIAGLIRCGQTREQIEANKDMFMK